MKGDNQPNAVLNARLALILQLRDTEHKTFNAIGVVIGTKSSRAQSLYSRAKRLYKIRTYGGKEYPYWGLSTRAENCCRALDLVTKHKIESAIKERRLHPDNNDGCRNYGWKTHTEILGWLSNPLSEL